MSLNIRGIPETKRAIEKVKLEVGIAAPEASKAGAKIIGQAAASRAPRNTGTTAGSITVSNDGEVAHVGPTTPYARFTEFGTIFVGGQHWMEQAAESVSGEVVAAITAVLKAAIE